MPMTPKQKDRLIIGCVIALPVGLVVLIGVATAWRNSTIRSDAPFTLEFKPTIRRNTITISDTSLRLAGRSGKRYDINHLSSLPTVYLSWDGEEKRLGRFEYG